MKAKNGKRQNENCEKFKKIDLWKVKKNKIELQQHVENACLEI